MIALFFALPEESKELIPLLQNARRSAPPPLPRWTGEFAGKPVMVAHTGVGMKSAQRIATEVLAGEKFSAAISSGFAGALDPSLSIGDLVIAKNYSDPSLLELARGELAPAQGMKVGALHTGAEVIETAQEKKSLFEKTHAIAVDMETSAIHSVCLAAGIPFLSLRAVSDTAEQDVPVPFPVWFDSHRQRPRVLPLLAYLAFHPRKVAPFAQFVSGVSIARASLTASLLTLLEKITY